MHPLEPPAPTLTVWDQLTAALREFVRVRRLDAEESVKPLLAPDESLYLELQLRLQLEQAQLAVLKRQQEVFQQSLGDVRHKVADYLKPDAPGSKVLVDELDALLAMQLAHPLPDVSGSLRELLLVRRGGE